MFFMGLNNAFFVALSVPLSMFVAYLIFPSLGFTMNMIVMFAFIFALGIVVDDAIVVIENTHRIHRHEPDIVKAAKYAAGEVFLPILSGTLTTLAPFFPLAFWPGIVGKFMHYLPVTLILTLFASLFVAYIINPVFAVTFMKHEYDNKAKRINKKKLLVISVVFMALAAIFYFGGVTWMGNLLMIAMLLNVIYRLVLLKLIILFQDRTWPWLMSMYERQLRFFLKGKNPWYLLGGITGLFFLTIIVVGIAKPPVLFFPNNQPNSIYVFVKMPDGTDQKVTDSVTKIVEEYTYRVIGKNNPYVESVISNVGFGASENWFDVSAASNKGKVTINFVESKFRSAISTTTYMDSLRKLVKYIPGVQVSVQKNQMGPPTGKPVNLEITGENLEELILTADNFYQIPGLPPRPRY